MNKISISNKKTINQLQRLEISLNQLDIYSALNVFESMNSLFKELDEQYAEKEQSIYPLIYNKGTDEICCIVKRMEFEILWSKSFFHHFRNTWTDYKEVREDLPLYKKEAVKFITIVKKFFETDENDFIARYLKANGATN